MKRNLGNSIGILAVALATIWITPGRVAAQNYILTDLGALVGTNNYALGINQRGQIVGYWTTGTNVRAFVYSGGTITDLGDLGTTNTYALSINAPGQITGFAEASNGVRSFVYQGGVLTNISALSNTNSYAFGINTNGQIVGAMQTSTGARAFIYANGTVTNIGTLGGSNSYAFAINASSKVAGSSLIAGDSIINAFQWFNGGLTNLNDLIATDSGWVLQEARSINDLGNIAGWGTTNSQQEGFVMLGGAFHSIGYLDGGTNSFAYSINNSNQVVGAASTSNGVPHALLWQNGNLFDLNNWIATNSGWELREARSINDRGQIVGWGVTNGQSRAFLLTWDNSVATSTNESGGEFSSRGFGRSRMTSFSSPELSPPGSGMLLWVKADAGITTGTGGVSVWADQSGNSNDLAQSSSSKRPQVAESVINGLPVVRFDGSDDYLDTPLHIGTNSYPEVTVYTVEIVRNYASSYDSVWSTDGNPGHYSRGRGYWYDGRFVAQQGGGTFEPSTGSPYGVVRVVGVNYQVDDTKVYVNGVEYAAGAPNEYESSDEVLRLGAGGSGGQNSAVDIAEMLVYDHAVVGGERADLESYLMYKYGLLVVPTITLTSPVEAGVYRSTNVYFAANVENGSLVTNVQFFANSTLIAEFATPPYAFTWTNAPAGWYTIVVRAQATIIGDVDSEPVDILVENPPAITLLTPADAQLFSPHVNLELTVSVVEGDGTVTNVAYYDRGVLIAAITNTPFTVTWSNVAAGLHVLTAIAKDNAGLSGTSSVANIVGYVAPPFVTNGLTLWLRADEVETGVDGVSRWPDLTGTGYDGVQSATNKQPQWVAGAMGGQPVVRFDGTNDYLDTTLFLATNALPNVTVYSVERMRSLGSSNVSVWSTDGTTPHGSRGRGYDASGTFVVQQGTGTFEPSVGGGWDLGRVVGIAYLTNDTKAVVNTALYSAGTNNAYASGDQSLRLGAGSSGNANAAVDMGEMIVFNRQLTTQERAQLESYLAMRYGLANRTPTLNTISNVVTYEDAGAQTVSLSGITAGADESQTLAVAAYSSDTGIIPHPSISYTSPNAAGSLSFTPVANSNGVVTISVVVSDSGSTTNAGMNTVTNTFTVTVNPVNDAPGFALVTNQVVSWQNGGLVSVSNIVTNAVAGPPNESAQVLTFELATDNTNAFTVQPTITDGVLRFQPAFNFVGTNSVTVVLHDNGGTNDGGVDASGAQTFAVVVTTNNRAPTINPIGSLTILTNSGLQMVIMMGISAGDGESQALSITAVSENTGLIPNPTVGYISPDHYGVLSFAPVADAVGTVRINVVVHDDGGTANHGIDSITNTFTITVTDNVFDGTNVVTWANSSGVPTNMVSPIAIAAGLANNVVLNADGTVVGWGAYGAPPTGLSNVIAIAAGGYNGLALQRDGTLVAWGRNDYGVDEIPSGISGTNIVGIAIGYAHGTVLKNDGTLASWGDNTYHQRDIPADLTNVVAISGFDYHTLALKGDGTVVSWGWNDFGQTNVPGDLTGVIAVSAGVNHSLALKSNGTVVAWGSNEYGQSDVPPELSGVVAVAAGGWHSLALKYDGTVVAWGYNYFGAINVPPALPHVLAIAGGNYHSAAIVGGFALWMNESNRAPALNSISDLTVNEDSGAHTVNLTGISAGVGETQNLFIIANSSNPDLVANPTVTYASPNSTGSLLLTPLTNAYGSATISVVVYDDAWTSAGGTNAVTNTFTITVSPVNDAPSFTLVTNIVMIQEDFGAQTNANFATNLVKGPANESGQTLSFTLTAASPSFFSTQPAIDGSGTLTYTVAANTNGTNLITVVLSDDGGTTNGGVDKATNTFSVVAFAVNDAPSFTLVTNVLTVLEDAGAQTNLYFATNIIGGPSDESGQTLSFTVTAATPAFFATQPSIDATGMLTYQAAANTNGTNLITVVLFDDGGTFFGGVDRTTNTFSVVVLPVNDAPSFTLSTNAVALMEDAGLQSLTNFVTNMVAGPADESGQVLTFSLTTTNTGFFAVQPVITNGNVLLFQVATNVYGTNVVTIVLSDNGGTNYGGVAAVTNTFSIVVAPVNDAPVANATNVTTLEDTTVTIMLTGTDLEGDSLTFSVVDSPSHGSLLGTAPNLSYLPATNYNGSDSFTFVAMDGMLTSAVAAVSITIVPVNDAPSFTLITNTVTVLEDAGLQSVTNLVTNLVAGPTDEAGQALSFIVTTTDTNFFAVQPTLTNGVLAFQTSTNVNGTNVITVELHDNGGSTNGGIDVASLAFNIVVTPVNDAPSFTMSTNRLVILEDAGAQTNASFVTNIQSGPADESLQTVYFTVSSTDTNFFAVQPVIDAGGTLTFTTATNVNGTNILAVVLLDNGGTSDGGVNGSATNTFSIVVSPVNDAPVANATNVTTLEDTAVSITLTGSDVEGASLTYAVVASPTNGMLSGTAPNLTYTPTNNYNGADAFTFKVNDGTNDSATATVSITVTAVNDAPSFTLATNVVVVLEDAGLQSLTNFVTNLVTGPVDESGQTLTFSLTTNASFFAVQPRITNVNVLVFQTATNVNGTNRVTVVLQDNGGTNNGGVDAFTNTFDIVVSPVNDAPGFTLSTNVVALAEDAGLYSVTNFVTGVTAGPADESGQVLTFSLTTMNTSFFAVQPVITNGILSFATATNVYGTNVVTVWLHDNGGTNNGGVDVSATNTFSIVVAPVNDAPVANATNVTTLEDTAVSITLTGSDVEGASLTYAVVASPTNGMLTGSAPNLTYTPTNNYNGADTFTFKVNDGTNDSAVAAVSITVTAVNDAPSFTLATNRVAVLEDAGLQSLTNFVTNLVAGPADESGQTLTFSLTTNASFFAVQPRITNGNVLVFQTATNVNGTNRVTIVLQDNGGTNNGGVDVYTNTFDIVVSPVNDAPGFTLSTNVVALAEDAGLQSLTNFVTGVTAGPADESSQVLTFSLTTTNTGFFAVQPVITNGILSFATATNVSGTNVVTIVLSDNGGTSNGGVAAVTNTFSIVVAPVNDVPVANATNVTTLEDTAVSITLAGSDVEGASLTYAVVASPTNGMLSGTAPNLTYTPTNNYNGVDAFTFKVNDGTNDSAAATVSITVTAVNDAPTVSIISPTNGASLIYPTNLVINVSASDIDGSVTQVVFYANGTQLGTLTVSPYTLIWTNADLGTHILTAVATDDGGVNSTSAPVTITISTPADPRGTNEMRLAYFSFDTSDWAGERSQLPLSYTNIHNVASWSSNALEVVGTNVANLKYRTVETDATANIALQNGTVRFWFKPDWSSTNAGGSGPGDWAQLISLGSFTSNASYGCWNLVVNSAGTEIMLITQTNGGGVTNFVGSISWSSNLYHQVAVTYTASNSLLYVDGLSTAVTFNGVGSSEGVGITNYPGLIVRQNDGLNIGSNRDGAQRAQGEFEEFETFNYPLSASEVLDQYESVIELVDSDRDGVPDIRDARPLNPAVGQLNISITKPANGSTLGPGR